MLIGRMPKLALLLLTCGAAPMLSGCDDPSSAAAAEPRIVQVGIVDVAARPQSLVHELPGRIAPTRIADVRPRVSGIVVERKFRQGSDVKLGDVLYQIDPKPFELELQAEEAELAKAVASRELAGQRAARVSTLADRHIASKEENEKAVATMRQAEAEVAARKAAGGRARLNLEYTTIRAPISGRIGAALISEGALVVQNDTANLATIQQLDPIYADFTQSVSDLLKLRRAFESGDLERIAPDTAKVRLLLDDGSLYPQEGKLLFSEAKADADTGQVTLRAEFPNASRILMPGMYVRVQIEQGIDQDAIAIPQQAVRRNAGGGSEVFLVDSDNRVSVKPVRTGSIQDGTWLILDGLKAGDRVVVDGFQKFAAGDRVAPVDWREAGPDEARRTSAANSSRD